MNHNDTDILDEVRAEIHDEKIHGFLTKYYKHMIVVVLAIIFGFSGYTYYTNRQIARSEALSETLYKKDYSALLSEKNIYGSLSAFQNANVLVSSGKHSEGLSLLLSIAKDSKFPEISNLAKIKASQLAMKYNISSETKSLIDLLSKDLDNPKRPLHNVMGIFLVQLLVADGNLNEAKKVSKQILSNESLTPEEKNFLTINS